MNPFQTSQGSANSSPSNLNRMVSLLNSMVTDLNLPNVQPKTTEIPERPVSAESGYISGKEDKQKSNVKAFEKPFTSCKEAKSETNEVSELKTIHKPQSKFLDQVPVVRKAVEPTTEKVPESAGQRGIPVIINCDFDRHVQLDNFSVLLIFLLHKLHLGTTSLALIESNHVHPWDPKIRLVLTGGRCSEVPLAVNKETWITNKRLLQAGGRY